MDIVKAGGHIWAQDRESSVIWGMPGAVVNENLTDKVLPLSQISNEILLQLQRK
jgi:two-component system chemotaxis response regulator CheB